jgi:hypothetical protein
VRALRAVEHRPPPEAPPVEPHRSASSLLARTVAWLLHPPPPARAPTAPARLAPVGPLPPEPPFPVVAVLGLARRAGASTIARALAARLAAEDPAGVAILHTPDPPRGAPPAASATRLARGLAAAGTHGVRAVGRLAVIRGSEPLAPVVTLRAAPLVADVGHGIPAEGVVALADQVVLVCPPALEPALCLAVETALRADGHSVTPLVNRALSEPGEALAHAVVVPDSRLAAQLTLACRDPRGELGRAIAEVAERSLQEARP